jgi:hypothetical protein
MSVSCVEVDPPTPILQMTAVLADISTETSYEPQSQSYSADHCKFLTHRTFGKISDYCLKPLSFGIVCITDFGTLEKAVPLENSRHVTVALELAGAVAGRTQGGSVTA